MSKQAEAPIADAADKPFSGKPSDTPCIETGCGNMYITRMYNAAGDKLKHVHPILGHTGDCQRCLIEAVDAVLNYCLDLGGEPAKIAKLLGGMRCPEPKRIKDSPELVLSCPDAIARAIKMKYEKPEVVEQ